MVDRQEVEALLEVVRGGTEQVCARMGVAPGHTVYAVEVDTLAALCRAWLELQDAPEVAVTECNQVPGTPDFDHGDMSAAIAGMQPGQRVRIVKEGE